MNGPDDFYIVDEIIVREGLTYSEVKWLIEKKHSDSRILGIFTTQKLDVPFLLKKVADFQNIEPIYVRCLNFWFFIYVVKNILIIYFRYLLQNVFLT
jgi:hypothetical protein